MHGAPLKHGKTGIFFGMKAPLMQDERRSELKSHIQCQRVLISRLLVRSMLTSMPQVVRVMRQRATDDEALEVFPAASTLKKGLSQR